MSSAPTEAGARIEGARRDSGDPYEILVVENDAKRLEALERALDADYRVRAARSAPDGLEILESAEVALILADAEQPSMPLLDFLGRAREIRPLAIRIALLRSGASEALSRAANDGLIHGWIEEPWLPHALQLAVRRGLETYQLANENIELAIELRAQNDRLHAENAELRRDLERRCALDGIIGSGPEMERVFERIEAVAGTDSSVLIRGEPGTGKGLVARAIHFASARRGERFVAQDCAALPDTLLESELFGHKSGAFTGAKTDKVGLFELAAGGTAFLEEVGETHSGMQVRLLRVLQDGEIRPLGSSDNRAVDVRVIASTSRDLLAEVGEGRFREDLFYRLRVVEIELPPLRERRADLPALAGRFLERERREGRCEASDFTRAALDCLARYEWPGNVRQLEDEIARAAAVSRGEASITPDMLSEPIRSARSAAPLRGAPSTPGLRLSESVDALKRKLILEAIAETGSKTRASEKLGIPRQSLQKMMKRLDLQA